MVGKSSFFLRVKSVLLFQTNCSFWSDMCLMAFLRLALICVICFMESSLVCFHQGLRHTFLMICQYLFQKKQNNTEAIAVITSVLQSLT